jgi:hypothetical protein
MPIARNPTVRRAKSAARGRRRTPVSWSRPRAVAQLAEHRSPKPGVAGSSPAGPVPLIKPKAAVEQGFWNGRSPERPYAPIHSNPPGSGATARIVARGCRRRGTKVKCPTCRRHTPDNWSTYMANVDVRGGGYTPTLDLPGGQSAARWNAPIQSFRPSSRLGVNRSARRSDRLLLHRRLGSDPDDRVGDGSLSPRSTGSTATQKRAKPYRPPRETDLRYSGQRRASTARPHLRLARPPGVQLRSLSARSVLRVPTGGTGCPDLVAERCPLVSREGLPRLGSSSSRHPQAQLLVSKSQEWVVS